ncbi:MAG: hypothetical protein RMK84_19940 [Oscillochloridaceae bacterium]|nr:hypothetical protein [Chloroflexaceae bacterium]MDW8392393.1 hypothetical protein [Oscillochloridaceae bacterium]
MDVEHNQGVEIEAVPASGGASRRGGAIWQAGYAVSVLALAALIALLAGAVAAGLQARRDEARSADMLLIVAPALPSQTLSEHAFAVYRRRYAPTVVIAGAGSEALRIALIERGAAEETLRVALPAATPVAELQEVLRSARRAGAASALVVAEPAELLLWLKLVGDHGLSAYGAPPRGVTPGPLALLRASGQYWRYALLQR